MFHTGDLNNPDVRPGRELLRNMK